MTYQPAEGDRVRATLVYEGIVKSLPEGKDQDHVRVDIENPPDGRGRRRYLDVGIWEFEKLADPEPVWVNGDVVKVPERSDKYPPVEFHRINDRWLTREGRGIAIAALMPLWWQAGQVKILYKADAA